MMDVNQYDVAAVLEDARELWRAGDTARPISNAVELYAPNAHDSYKRLLTGGMS